VLEGSINHSWLKIVTVHSRVGHGPVRALLGLSQPSTETCPHRMQRGRLAKSLLVRSLRSTRGGGRG
jgi:hypothetical protein